MTCTHVQELLPDIIRNPGLYPEAEAHINACANCRKEMSFLRELQEGISTTLPDPVFSETVGQKIRLAKRIRQEQVRRPMIYVAAMAAVLALTMILPMMLGNSNPPQFYAEYDTETENVLSSIDMNEGWQITTDEIAMYLLENADMETIEELGLENYQVTL